MSSDVTTKDFATDIRISTLEMISQAGSSHVGSCLSMADIIACLYNVVMKFDPADPNWEDRDRFILSKGHACAIVYAALAHKGFFEKSDLMNYAQAGSSLMAHISHRVPGVEFSTGSLGHGLPFAAGKALGAKISGQKWQTFVVLGDGELDEGSNWEALLFASHHELTNLTVIVDVNNLQSFTTTQNTLSLAPLPEKLISFGAEVVEVDGHSSMELTQALIASKTASKPTVILAKTIKGKGVDYMEGLVEWHYKCPNPEQLAQAISQLEAQR